jgi:hypothetical protein
MKDPDRFLCHAGTFEARLLGSLNIVEPPDLVRDAIWRRVEVVTGAAALSGVATLGAKLAASGGSVAASFARAGDWLPALKWIAVVATVAPSLGLGAHWAVTARTMPVIASSPSSFPQAVRAHGDVPTSQDPLPDPVKVAPDRPSGTVARGVLGARTSLATSNLDAESSLLKRAREKLENADARGALDDVTLLAARFPRGELTQEREVVAIKALLFQGNLSAAATRAASFLHSYPSSPYADALRQSLQP